MIMSVDTKYKDACDDKVMFIDYANLPAVITPGKTIYVDDGILAFVVKSVEGSV